VAANSRRPALGAFGSPASSDGSDRAAGRHRAAARLVVVELEPLAAVRADERVVVPAVHAAAVHQHAVQAVLVAHAAVGVGRQECAAARVQVQLVRELVAVVDLRCSQGTGLGSALRPCATAARHRRIAAFLNTELVAALNSVQDCWGPHPSLAFRSASPNRLQRPLSHGARRLGRPPCALRDARAMPSNPNRLVDVQ